jgi:hypothetical protein
VNPDESTAEASTSMAVLSSISAKSQSIALPTKPPTLICIKRSGCSGFQHGSMDRLIIFRCPATGLDVQTSLPLNREEEDQGQRHYDSISCPACSRLHFVNRKTGKLLGERE